MKYGDLTLGQVEAVVNKLGGMDGVGRFLRGEIVMSESIRSWTEQDGVITFSVTSDGTTGEDWIKRLEGRKLRVGDYAKRVLVHKDFKPTKGVTTKIVVLKGLLFTDDDRITKSIRAEAKRRKLGVPNAEVACLIREKFTDKEIEAMGLWWIVAMHEAIEILGGGPSLLGANRGDGGRWLHAFDDRPGRRWDRGLGFAFAASQVSA